MNGGESSDFFVDDYRVGARDAQNGLLVAGMLTRIWAEDAACYRRAG